MIKFHSIMHKEHHVCAGVLRALQIVHKELDVTMGLCGVTNIEHVNADILWQKQSLP